MTKVGRCMASTGLSETATTGMSEESPDICLPAPQLAHGALVIPPFRVCFLNQWFIHWQPMRIELANLVPDRYRIMVVQNFWIEDPNPDLTQCLAGIFLARRRRDGQWEAAENWPVECRSIAAIGELDLRDAAHPRLTHEPPC
ncbi:hypothetical protein [Denitromonas iodatirespirans]|uniref:Uncharacterized protein n=1 Tax=Denitromonas iodatirespirans TaxID=2795389 RepID=A0A944DBM9_DENI1|nr:hypothetical protein [Denitromonas iodatirespirans]MBT0963810.1 hypothetical protein [Denitromonas iodatirespirans]